MHTIFQRGQKKSWIQLVLQQIITENNGPSQTKTLMEKRLSEIQALDSQIHATLQIDVIEAAITTSTDLND